MNEPFVAPEYAYRPPDGANSQRATRLAFRITPQKRSDGYDRARLRTLGNHQHGGGQLDVARGPNAARQPRFSITVLELVYPGTFDRENNRSVDDSRAIRNKWLYVFSGNSLV